MLENSNSDDSESNEPQDKRIKKIQRSPKSKRMSRTAASKKGQTKNQTKPSVHVTVESTSSTSPTDEQARNLTVKGKAVKGRVVRDPHDDETFLVSVIFI